MRKVDIYKYRKHRGYISGLMRVNKLSFRDMAALLGISKGVLHGICKKSEHKRHLTAAIKLRLAQVFELTYDEQIYLTLLSALDRGRTPRKEEIRILDLVTGGSTEWLKDQ